MEDIHARLRRYGLMRGAAGLKPRPRRQQQSIEEVIPGEVVGTPHGPFFLGRRVYEPGTRHGNAVLSDLLGRPSAAAALARDPRLVDLDPERLAFLDVETTGLAGGTGTYCFLVGVGRFEGASFVLYQFFMRDFNEEHALLAALGELLDGLGAVVSFNGKAFDLPLIETRFILARQRPRLVDAPHLDLLGPARRIWKHRLPSCALSSLEVEVLGLQRAAGEIPGWAIPDVYLEYVRSGDVQQIARVFSHNAQDILSLVTLAMRLYSLVTDTPPGCDGLPGEDLYGLAGLMLDLDQAGRAGPASGCSCRAEALYARAASTCRSAAVRELARRDLAGLLKRQERRAEALPWWQALAADGAVYACEELAKHYEWHDADLPRAAGWTRQALALATDDLANPRREEVLQALSHRLARLEAKLSPDRSPVRNS